MSEGQDEDDRRWGGGRRGAGVRLNSHTRLGRIGFCLS